MSALRFWHYFRNTFGKIKQKPYIASESAHTHTAPREGKFWVCLYSCYRNCQRKFRRWCNSKDNKTIRDNMKNFLATSSISYCKPTRRRHELTENKEGRNRRWNSQKQWLTRLPKQTGVCMRHRQKMQQNWWFCVVHEHNFTEWETYLNFWKRYLHWMYNGDEVTTNDAWFHVSGCTNSQNNRQWSKNTVIIHGVLLNDE